MREVFGIPGRSSIRFSPVSPLVSPTGLARFASVNLTPNIFARLACTLALTYVAAPHLNAAPAPDALPVPGLKVVAEGFVSPTNLRPLDDGSGRLLVADQVGVIYVLGPDGKRSETPFLDLRPKLAKIRETFDERGILGLALHPQFKSNRRFFVYYSAPLRAGAPAGWDHTSHLSEFQVTEGDRAKADPASERVVLQVDKPQDNHNCGRIAFGPDGFLYIGVGDGGGGNDSAMGHGDTGNGQNTQVLLGKVLRIDVDGTKPYGIPRDNPFADGKKGRPEIFAYGLRNPWGISFDRGGTHQLFAADVGQTLFEEVNILRNGGNYGWRAREGFGGFDPTNPNKAPENPPRTGAMGEPFIDPIAVYKNLNGFRKDPEAYGISVTGGYVYRGKALPALQGRYIFGDWSQSWALPMGILLVATPPATGSGTWAVQPLAHSTSPKGMVGGYIVAFGEDADGELYLLLSGKNTLSGSTGKVLKLVAM